MKQRAVIQYVFAHMYKQIVWFEIAKHYFSIIVYEK